MQNEWDELTLETFTLRQHLDATRQELSQALYQHDAACRVIARLVRERDEARAMLTTFHSGGGGGGHVSSSNEMDVAHVSSESLPDNVLQKITDKNAELSSTRRGRKAPDTLPSREQISSLSAAESFSPHKAAKPGVTCLAVTQDASYILTGGNDKDVLLSCGVKVVSKMAGHDKKVNCVAFHPSSLSTVFSASADGSVKVWRGDVSSGYSNDVTFTNNSDEVTGLSVHPTGSYAVSASKDGSWSFLDLEGGTTLKTVYGSSKDMRKTSLFLFSQFLQSIDDLNAF